MVQPKQKANTKAYFTEQNKQFITKQARIIATIVNQGLFATNQCDKPYPDIVKRRINYHPTTLDANNALMYYETKQYSLIYSPCIDSCKLLFELQ